ncbi:hypothetical protein [Actinophytocola sp.]|uniref:hypothetical protein n=1 Tax=Actinophytocola sp. TaxID=1872138 RepID=UPI0039C87026
MIGIFDAGGLAGHRGQGGGDFVEGGFDVGGGGVGVAGAGDAVAEVAFDPGQRGAADSGVSTR